MLVMMACVALNSSSASTCSLSALGSSAADVEENDMPPTCVLHCPRSHGTCHAWQAASHAAHSSVTSVSACPLRLLRTPSASLAACFTRLASVWIATALCRGGGGAWGCDAQGACCKHRWAVPHLVPLLQGALQPSEVIEQVLSSANLSSEGNNTGMRTGFGARSKHTHQPWNGALLVAFH